jgi:tRNA threonylcarbamoyladenosine biosynthesis protein TsaE
MKFLSKSLTDTSRFAGALLKKVNKGPNLIILSGPIGAGKTELVRAIAERLDIKEKIQSPTFGIRKEYAGMVHYDLYMANKINSNEFVSMLNEDLEENLVIVE